MLDPIFELHAIGDLAEEVRRMFDELAQIQPGCRGVSGEYAPDLDVVETPEAFELRLDVPGVGRDALRVCFTRGAVVIAGHKPAPEAPSGSRATFHRVERGFGRFARAIRLPGAIDASRARAALRAGELLVIVPKIRERRDREIVVPIE